MKTPEKKEGKTAVAPGRIVMITAGLVGIVLLVFGSFIGGGEEKKEAEYTDVGFYTEYLEERIKKLCLSVSGISEAEVFLTIDCSSEFVYGEGGDYLILSGSDGEEAVMLCEIYPKVRGIAVVCTGGEQAGIKATLTSLLSAALDLPSNKIEIAGS